MTSYPLPQQYQQALQKPRLSLFDDELKNGTIQADRMGLPRVRSGNFASVYKVFAGSSQYAIKCFLNAPDDIQTRYEEISTYLNTINCEYFLKTHYLARGIAVNGHTYPILKIKWQDGTPLDKYIDDCVRRQDTQGILNIRARFVNLYRTLRSYHIAHGDLQHGNILITQQGLRLIDYDGLYVPTTTLNISHESGHPNYQHPKRTTWHFNEHMDTFSATAIFTALTILAYDLSLWAKFYNGDNILFCGKDFLNTNQSPLFRRLAGIDDATIKQLVTAIAASCLSQKPPDSPDFLELCADATVSGQEMPLPPIAPISPHSWITTWEGLPTQSDIDIVEAVPIANPGPVDASIRKAEDRPSTIPAPPTPPQPKPHTLSHSPSWQIKISCPNCNAANDQSTALCIFCGYILSVPRAIQPPPTQQAPPPPLQAAQNISALAKLRWSLLYFILFFLALAAYDQTDNNRELPQKAIAFIEAGKDRLFGRKARNHSKETAEYSKEIAALSKIIASTPNNAAAYIKRGDAYMKAGHITEAANDYKTAARLGIATAQDTVIPKNGDNSSLTD